MTLKVLDFCKPIVDKKQPYIVQIEHEIYEVLLQMLNNPIHLDRPYLQRASEDLTSWVGFGMVRVK